MVHKYNLESMEKGTVYYWWSRNILWQKKICKSRRLLLFNTIGRSWIIAIRKQTSWRYITSRNTSGIYLTCWSLECSWKYSPPIEDKLRIFW